MESIHCILFKFLQKTWLKLRNLTLRCLVAASTISAPHGASNGTTDGSVTANNDSSNKNVAETLRDLISQLSSFISEAQGEYTAVKEVGGFVCESRGNIQQSKR